MSRKIARLLPASSRRITKAPSSALEKGACVERVVPVAMSWFYVAMQREPVVMWSCFIGFTGENPPNPFPRPSRLTPFRDVAHTEGFFSSLHPIQLWGCSSRADDAARVTAAARRPDCPNTQTVTRLSSSSKPSHRPSSFSQTDDDYSTFASQIGRAHV